MNTTTLATYVHYLEQLQKRFNPLTIDIATTAMSGHFHSYTKLMEEMLKTLSNQGVIRIKNGIITLNTK